MIRFDRFTQKAQEAIQQSQSIAGEGQHQAVHPVHLLIALAQESEGIIRPVLEKVGVHPDLIPVYVSRLDRGLDFLID